MSTPSFGLNPLDAERKRLERRRALVDILQKQALAGPQAPTMPGAQMSPYQGLASMGEALIAALANRAQEKREKEFAGKELAQAKEQAQAMTDYLMPYKPYTPPTPGMVETPTEMAPISSQLNLTTPIRPIPQNVQQLQAASQMRAPEMPEPVSAPLQPQGEQRSPYGALLAGGAQRFSENQNQRSSLAAALASGSPLGNLIAQDIVSQRNRKQELADQLEILQKRANLDVGFAAPGSAIVQGGKVTGFVPNKTSQESPFAKINPKDFTADSLTKFANTGDFADLVPRQEPEKISANARPMTQDEANSYNIANEAVILNAGGTAKDVEKFRVNPGQPISFADDIRAAIGQWVGGTQAKATRAFSLANQNKKIDSGILTNVYNAYSPAIDSAERFNVMADAAAKAKKGDQQAGLALLASHLGMTAGLQKGMRITKGMYEEAINSRPWLQGAAAKFGEGGYLGGVALSSSQIDQMLSNAEDRFKEDNRNANSKKRYWDKENEVIAPDRDPSDSVVKYYVTLYGRQAKQKMIEDGWSVK